MITIAINQLETLLDRDNGTSLLTPELEKTYNGGISFPPAPAGRPYLIINFVASLDGIVSFGIPGHHGGGDISGFNAYDTFVMGLLRTLCDAVMAGANAIRQNPAHLWTPSFISPPFTASFRTLRQKLGKSKVYSNYFVTGSGKIKPDDGLSGGRFDLPTVFHSDDVEPWIITTINGQPRVANDYPELANRILVFPNGHDNEIDMCDALSQLRRYGIEYLLVEVGPTLVGSLMKPEQMLVDEIFLTVAPQVVGNSRQNPRITFAEETLFTPDTAPWFDLVSVKLDEQKGSTLLKRYRRKQP